MKHKEHQLLISLLPVLGQREKQQKLGYLKASSVSNQILLLAPVIELRKFERASKDWNITSGIN